jgi:hypothetical protein
MVAISKIGFDTPPIEWIGSKPWYQPTFSPEQGVLLVLLGSLLTGASVAQAWTWQTSLAGLGAFLALQAENPMTVQIKQRRSLKPRYLLWSAVYGSGALAIALWLTYLHPSLIWVCAGAAIAECINILAVFQRRQRVISVEIIMFGAICLSTLFAYGATAHHLSSEAVGMWLLNTLVFSSAVFTIKLRKVKTSSLCGGLVYHGIAVVVVALLYGLGWLSLLTALTFSVALLKLAVVICFRDWYCNCRFEYIARFETYFALSYTALACLTVLPARLPPPG